MTEFSPKLGLRHTYAVTEQTPDSVQHIFILLDNVEYDVLHTEI